MFSRKTVMLALSALTLASLVLTACGGPAPTPQTVVVTAPPQVQVQTAVVTSAPVVQTQVVQVTAAPPKGPKTLRIGTFGAGDVPTIDPSLTTDTTSVQIVEETSVGLTRQNDETGAAEPGMVTKWDISPDGKVYTLHIMQGVPWVRYNPTTKQVEKVQDDKGNDRMVTAGDFAYGIVRTLDPKTASDYAYVLTTVIAGADDFNTGKITDTAKVGVKALDDYTLEVTLTAPAAYAIQILGMWVAHAEPQWIIADKGDRWTETGFQQSYGPYTLKSWNHDSDMTLIKNPFWPGTSNIPQAKIDEIFFSMLDTSPSFANYEAGQTDVSGVPLSELDRVKADATLSKELHIGFSPCTYYYGFNVKKPPFDNPKVRLAFSEAIDRKSLIDNVTKGGQEPAQWFARPGLAAAPTIQDYPDLGVKYNPDDAKSLLASVYPDVSKIPPITLMVNQVEGHVKIAEAIKAMWKTTLGVDVTIQQQEWKVYLKTLQTDAPQIYRLGWCEDYPDANNFDKEVFHSGSSQNNTGWTNKQFDDLVDQAATETDTKKREDLYSKAEDILVKQEAAIAPIYWYTSIQVTKPNVQRLFAQGAEHYEKWDITQ